MHVQSDGVHGLFHYHLGLSNQSADTSSRSPEVSSSSTTSFKKGSKVSKLKERPKSQEKGDAKIIPIIYNVNYDIKFFKMEHLHPFDTKKWGRIASHIKSYLENRDAGKSIKFLSPKRMVAKEELEIVHSKDFVKRIHNSRTEIASAAEVGLLIFLPLKLIRSHLLEPLKWQVSGTILAAKVALDTGYCINLGGGFHHCSHDAAGGFCLFADITLLIYFVWNEISFDSNILIIDLDAHQGNGYARDVIAMGRRKRGASVKDAKKRSISVHGADTNSNGIGMKLQSDHVYIMDMYNSRIYPRDEVAKEAINRAIELKPHTKDKEYLELLSFHLVASLTDFKPDLVVYNAGTDILIGDKLGKLDISRAGVIERDKLVFSEVRGRNIPIVMLTSGGYQSNNYEVVASSIENLIDKRIIEI